MNTLAIVTVVGAILGSVLTAFATVKVAQIGSKSTQEGVRQDGILAYTRELKERLDKVEGRVTALETQLDAADRVIRSAAVFIDRVGMWLANRRRGPMPTPSPLLQEHIDITLWSAAADDGQPDDITRP